MGREFNHLVFGLLLGVLGLTIALLYLESKKTTLPILKVDPCQKGVAVRMAINSFHLRTCVIRPVLKDLGLWSPIAENLLLGTAAQESHMGTYLDQADPTIEGPALGIFQIEVTTHDDVWENYLAYQENYARVVRSYSLPTYSYKQLAGNLYYGAAVARLIYRRVKEPLPTDPNDIKAMARYWKLNYNTSLGKGTVEEFEANYKRYVNL